MNEMMQWHWWDWWLLGLIILFISLFLILMGAFLIRWRREEKREDE